MEGTPNVVLITIDSLRADHAAPERGLMPALSGLGADGVRCSRAFSNGYSTPIAFPAILTGTLPEYYGGAGYMSDSRPFLAEFLSERGYRTAAFHSNPHLRAENNYDTGFDTYADFDSDADTGSSLRYLVTSTLDSDSALYSALRRLYHLFRTTSASADYIRAEAINDRLLEWVDTLEGGDPFFAWGHYMDPHYPFYPPDEFVDRGSVSARRAVSLNGTMQEDPDSLSGADRADLLALYEGDVRYTDHHLGRLLDGFERRGLAADTVFVVTADHGELFGEHGLYGHPPTLYDESIHVPLAVAGPGVPTEGFVDRRVSLVDVAPTVARLVGAEPIDRWDGRDVFDAGDREPLVFGSDRVLGAQSDRWRLIWWREVDCPADPDREWELLDTATGDRVAGSERPELRDRLAPLVEGYLERAAETDERLPETDPDGAVRDRLEALGYR